MDTEHFKRKLEQEFTVVEAELKSVGVQNPHNPADWEATERKMDVMSAVADPNEAADKQEEYVENRAINDTLEIRYNNIKRALKKIEDGTYGTCEMSNEPIEPERLEANPAARTCKAHMNEEKNLPS
ncbi:MAG: TraR/DksA C4-type zinc finger protein [Candidatus Adlerbacteria bacterium]|nr:TraR/DksA C4-type zinc finger protein [Candidatus Adlerbacteria bacterium]MDZ4226306.1 TraR/DksA C4-type zinc finger protein [Patescibacteria group bacterium]